MVALVEFHPISTVAFTVLPAFFIKFNYANLVNLKLHIIEVHISAIN